MMKKDMMERFQNEPTRMDAAEEAWLDERLTSPAQAQIAEMVQALPNDEPELAWRSELSAKIHAIAGQRQRKQRFNWLLRPALGVSAAAVLAVVFMFKSEPSPVSVDREIRLPSLEQEILSAHQEASQTGQVWSAMSVDDGRVAPTPAVQEYRWDDLDLGTL